MSVEHLVPILTGLLIAAIGLPLALDKIPPNALYGFRTPRTMSDERVWYPANRYAGKGLTAAGLLGALAAAVTGWIVDDPTFGVLYSMGAMLVPLAIGIAYAFYKASLFVAELDAKDEADSGPRDRDRQGEPDP